MQHSCQLQSQHLLTTKDLIWHRKHSMNQIWFKNKITGHQQGFSWKVNRGGSSMFWVRDQFTSFPSGFYYESKVCHWKNELNPNS